MGLVKAGFSFANKPFPEIFAAPPLLLSALFLAILAFAMVRIPLSNAGRPDEPAPRLVFDEIGAQSQATVEALKILHDAGLLDEDEVLKQFIRVKFKLPKPSPKSADQPIEPSPPARG